MLAKTAEVELPTQMASSLALWRLAMLTRGAGLRLAAKGADQFRAKND